MPYVYDIIYMLLFYHEMNKVTSLKLEQTVDIAEKIIYLLEESSNNPYFPVWGELFYILWTVKKEAEQRQTTLSLYPIHPIGYVTYDINDKLFVAHIPGCLIKMNIDELIQMLLSGSVLPSNQN